MIMPGKSGSGNKPRTKKKKPNLGFMRGGIMGRTMARRSAGGIMEEIRKGKKKKK